ncbi:hypothetical protein E4U61_005058 [Claviceps capensis]|nr:hypothetical protein E4U61_005058 [Claviceps capensis]
MKIEVRWEKCFGSRINSPNKGIGDRTRMLEAEQSNKNSSNSRSTSVNTGKNKRIENGRSEASDYDVEDDDDDDDDDDDGQLPPVQRAVATWVGLANPDDIDAGYVGGVM